MEELAFCCALSKGISITSAFIKRNIAWRMFPWTTCTSLSELKSIHHFYFELGHRVGFLIQLCQHSSDKTTKLTESDGFNVSWNPSKTPCSLKNKWLQLRKMFSPTPFSITPPPKKKKKKICLLPSALEIF